jgi:hypothetical protein
MRRVSSFPKSFYFGLALTAAGSVACSENSSPALPPNLIGLELVDPSGAVFDITAGQDAGAAQRVSPLSVVRATFSALLDPSKVQDLSGTAPAAGRGVAKIQWISTNGPTELGLLAQYNPSHRMANGVAPTVTFSAPEVLPSGVAITFVLDKMRLTDKAGNPYVGPTMGTFESKPFSSVVVIPAGALPPSFLPRVGFSSLPAPLQPGAIRVVRANTDVAINVLPDPSSRTSLLVSRAGEGATWSAGTYQLILAPEKITDLFGSTLPAGPLEYTFVIGAANNTADAATADAGSFDGG